MLARILAVILFSAGILHGVKPELFLVAMPPYIPWHLEIVLLTGVLEFALAAGLYFQHSRKKAALLSCLYFIAILPAHIHVSLNHIPMFGVSSPLLLWGRTLFQSVFIAWAYGIYRSK
jgi:uncharacterized membrane protein